MKVSFARALICQNQDLTLRIVSSQAWTSSLQLERFKKEGRFESGISEDHMNLTYGGNSSARSELVNQDLI